TTLEKRSLRRRALPERFRSSPIAIPTDGPNQQHYEAPARFSQTVLGPRLKYSCCPWPAGVETLAEAEEAMLALTGHRADLADGQEILDLGCGWGSLSLWRAQTFFAGGAMPSNDLLLHFQDGVRRVDHGRLDDTHYARTLRA
ncbi:MAG: hypothetical protein GX605_14055, partial [Chloroflexi bacterium]|nr:hypothetical protein [Chloroflexota bacterium]